VAFFLFSSKSFFLLYIPLGLFWEYFSLDSQLLITLTQEGTPLVDYVSVVLVYSATGLFVLIYLLATLYTIVQFDTKQSMGAFAILRWTMGHLFGFIKLFVLYLFQLMVGIFCLILPGQRKFVFFSFFPLIFIRDGIEDAKASMDHTVPGQKGRKSHGDILFSSVLWYSLTVFHHLFFLMRLWGMFT